MVLLLGPARDRLIGSLTKPAGRVDPRRHCRTGGRAEDAEAPDPRGGSGAFPKRYALRRFDTGPGSKSGNSQRPVTVSRPGLRFSLEAVLDSRESSGFYRGRLLAAASARVRSSSRNSGT